MTGFPGLQECACTLGVAAWPGWALLHSHKQLVGELPGWMCGLFFWNTQTNNVPGWQEDFNGAGWQRAQFCMQAGGVLLALTARLALVLGRTSDYMSCRVHEMNVAMQVCTSEPLPHLYTLCIYTLYTLQCVQIRYIARHLE